MALPNHIRYLPHYIFAVILLAACSSPPKEATLPLEDFCAKIHRNDSISLTSELAGVAHLMEEKTGVHVLEDGAGSMVTRAWLTEYAEKTISFDATNFVVEAGGLPISGSFSVIDNSVIFTPDNYLLYHISSNNIICL